MAVAQPALIATLFAALGVATVLVTSGHDKRRRRIEPLAFTDKLIRQYPANQEIHRILGNLRTHSEKSSTGMARHPNMHFHLTPAGTS